MLHGRRPYQNKPSLTSPRRLASHRLALKRMQSVYSRPMTLLWFFMFLLFAGPLFYLSYQNYFIFEKIAFDSHPTLLSQIEREQIWILFLFFSGLLIAPALNFWISNRITKKTFQKVDLIEKQLHDLSNAKWSKVFNSLEKKKNENRLFLQRNHNDNVFESLIDTYRVMLKNTVEQFEEEFDLIKKLYDLEQNKQATRNDQADLEIRARLIKKLLQIKKHQLGHTTLNASKMTNDLAALSDATPLKHRAS